MAFEKIKGMFKKAGEDSDYVEIDIGKEAKKANYDNFKIFHFEYFLR